MRDPERIDKVLNIIRLVWSECPDLRLMQLILNSLYKSDKIIISADSVLYIEDEMLMKAIAEYGIEFVKDETEDKLLVESGILNDLIEEVKNGKSTSWQDFFEDWEEERDRPVP